MQGNADTGTLEQASEIVPHGVTEVEALARRRRGQANKDISPTSRSYWQIITENVFTFINICLFGLGIALTLLGRYGDALVSTGVISLNIVVSVVQEIRAKRTLDHIALLARPTATRCVRERSARFHPRISWWVMSSKWVPATRSRWTGG